VVHEASLHLERHKLVERRKAHHVRTL
jgi:hypothetical protein